MKRRTSFDFIAYMPPPPANARGDGNACGEGNDNFQTSEHYQNIVDCGFNGVSAIYEYDEQEYHTALTLCDRMGLTMLVRDQKGLEPYVVHRLCKGGESVEEWISEHGAAFQKRMDEYAKHPSFAGILAADEPHMGKFPHLRKLQDWFKERYPDKEFEINLLPDYASGEQLTGIENAPHDYQQHLDTFADVVQPEYLSYDHYALCIDPTTKKPYLRASYLKNLEMVAKTAKVLDVPFKVFLLTLGHWDFRTVSKYEDIAWQIYTSLAYGAVGAQTFTYWTMLGYPPGNAARVTTGVVGAKGELLPAWHAMKEVLHEARAFEKQYCTYTWQKCLYYLSGEKNALTENLDKNTDDVLLDAQTDRDILVGCFVNGKGKRAYLIANVTDPADGLEAETTLRFASDTTASVWQGGKMERMQTSNGCRLHLRSGEGVFLELE